MFPPPKIPWQVTGNHWVSLPCIHPADGSIHAAGVIVRRLRGAVEFAGSSTFLEGTGEPLLRLGVAVEGRSVDLGSSGMAWQRVSEWLPTFNTTIGDLIIRGTIFGPHGRSVELPGFVYAVSFENRGTRDLVVTFTPNGVLGHRQHRVQTARPLSDAHTFTAEGGTLTLSGASPYAGAALAIGVDDTVASGTAAAEHRTDGAVTWSVTQQITVPPKQHVETAIYVTAAPERDGAVAALGVMRQRGWRSAAEGTRQALSAFEQSTGVPNADRLVNRHLMFAYFASVVRAIDDARIYVVRTRVPWNSHGLTIRDWDALMWILPAVQLADPEVARELLLRICELHGYAPGRGVNYLDGAPFRPGFSLDGAAAYAIAIDRYISQTGDDQIVEEHVIADTLYGSYEDIAAHRSETVPLYSTDETASGAPMLYVPEETASGGASVDAPREVTSSETSGDASSEVTSSGTSVDVPNKVVPSEMSEGASTSGEIPMDVSRDIPSGTTPADASNESTLNTPSSHTGGTSPQRITVLPYSLHANAIVAYALDIFSQTLDEKTAVKVESGDMVRSAILRHFQSEPHRKPPILKTAVDLKGAFTLFDDPVSSVYWLPLYETLSRTDTTYRRTVKALGVETPLVSALCARLIGPDAQTILDQFRRAPMDNGVAAEVLDAQGNATGNGGDAALSGLVAYTVWYAVHALGVRF